MIQDSFRISKHFTWGEWHCRCGKCTSPEPNPWFLYRLERLREAVDRPIHVNSWYRCPEHNASISHTGRNGPHTTGRAIDIYAQGPFAWHLISEATALGFTGIGVNQKGVHRFIHLDDLTEQDGFPRPTIWSY